jgi:pimeloyl-ACP methyl ester carboxylesterase
MTSKAVPEQIAVDVPGGALEVNVQGDGALVLLIHGTAPAAWGELPARLSAGRRVAAYDRRSFGAARSLAADGLSLHASDAGAVIAALGGPAVVVGWSMGGVIALELAARHPELVAGMVLIEPPLQLKRHPRPGMLAAIAAATILGKLGRGEAGAQRFLRWALGRRDGSSDLAAMPPAWHARLAAGDGAAVVRELAAGTGEHLDRALLAGITAPVRILRGDRSRPAFATSSDRAAHAARGTLIDVPGAGHAIQLDAPDAVTAAIEALA